MILIIIITPSKNINTWYIFRWHIHNHHRLCHWFAVGPLYLFVHQKDASFLAGEIRGQIISMVLTHVVFIGVHLQYKLCMSPCRRSSVCDFFPSWPDINSLLLVLLIPTRVPGIVLLKLLLIRDCSGSWRWACWWRSSIPCAYVPTAVLSWLLSWHRRETAHTFLICLGQAYGKDIV